MLFCLLAWLAGWKLYITHKLCDVWYDWILWYFSFTIERIFLLVLSLCYFFTTSLSFYIPFFLAVKKKKCNLFLDNFMPGFYSSWLIWNLFTNKHRYIDVCVNVWYMYAHQKKYQIFFLFLFLVWNIVKVNIMIHFIARITHISYFRVVIKNVINNMRNCELSLWTFVNIKKNSREIGVCLQLTEKINKKKQFRLRFQYKD